MKKKIEINLDERSKMILTAAGIAALAIFISAGVSKSFARRSHQARAQAVEESNILALRQDMEKLNSIKDEYSKYIYKKADTFAFRDTISKIARKSGINIVSIQPQAQEKIGAFAKISFNLKLRCTYNSLGDFMASIENLPEITKVENLSSTTMSRYTERIFDDKAGNAPVDEAGGEAESEVMLVISVYALSS